jgi:hypothetical protein
VVESGPIESIYTNVRGCLSDKYFEEGNRFKRMEVISRGNFE